MTNYTAGVLARSRMGFAVFALATVMTSVAGAAPADAGYHVVKTIPVPGTGTYFDYLHADAAARRVYVSFETEVAVIDADSLDVVGHIPSFKKVHGIATIGGRVFVSDGGAGLVRAVDQRTLAPLGDVPAGKNPDAIMADPASKHVFAFNHSGGDATVIDAHTLKVVATIPLGGAPEFAVADGHGQVWVNIEDESEIARIDARKNVVTARWSLKPCEEPSGLAIDVAHRRLFAGCGNKMTAVIDADKGTVITTLPIGPGVDATTFDAEAKTIFNSCGADGGVLALAKQSSADVYAALPSIPTHTRAKTMALDTRTHRVFLSTADFGPAPPVTAAAPRPRPVMVPGSFRVLVLAP